MVTDVRLSRSLAYQLRFSYIFVSCFSRLRKISPAIHTEYQPPPTCCGPHWQVTSISIGILVCYYQVIFQHYYHLRISIYEVPSLFLVRVNRHGIASNQSVFGNSLLTNFIHFVFTSFFFSINEKSSGYFSDLSICEIV